VGFWTLSLAGCALSGHQSAQRHLSMESFAEQVAPQPTVLEKDFRDTPDLGWLPGYFSKKIAQVPLS
jgi:hypothetical protein